MNRCLRERELVLFQAEDGTAAQRRHVAGCAVCAERLRRLREDLTVIDQVLEEEPPRRRRVRAPAWRRAIWIPAAAAAVALLVVMNLLFAWQWSRMRAPEVASQVSAAGTAAAATLSLPPTPLDAPQLAESPLDAPVDDPWLNEALQSLPLGDLES